MSVNSERRRLSAEVLQAASTSPGETERGLRERVRTRASEVLAGAPFTDELPTKVAAFVDALVRDARGADVVWLLDEGFGDDGALELAINTAVVLSDARLAHGLRAIKEDES